jgi:HK97 gp10 family phage protein
VASSVSIELKGFSGLLSRAKLLVPRVRAGAEATVAQTALLIETDAKLLAPVDTGRLRASIHTELSPDKLKAMVLDGVTYGIYREFGTRYSPATPFLFPAYEKNRAAFAALLKANTKLF